nr:DUF418 domain-containing protein [Pseudonocardia acidicola]
MVLVGAAHGALLWSGDIVGAYGLLAVLLAGVLVAGTAVTLITVAAIGLGVAALFGLGSALPLPGTPQSFLASTAVADPLPALGVRLGEWVGGGLLAQAAGVFAAVALGAWAARRGLLDEPERHRLLLTRVAVGGLVGAVLGGTPLALIAAGVWTGPPTGALLLAGAVHAVSGYAGGLGYAALFGLLAIRLTARETRGPVAGALQACGRRSLTCYLAQSVVFVALLPAWTLGLGRALSLWQVALIGLGAWLLSLPAAAAMDRAGHRGPAEVLLRRLTYGRPAVPTHHRP